MAKKTNTELEQLQEAQNLALKNSKEILLKVVDEKHIEELRSNYLQASHGGLKDLQSYKYIKNGLKDVSAIIRDVKKIRKQITDPALTFQKEMIQVEKDLIEKLEPIKNHLTEQKTNYEDLKQAEDNKKLNAIHDQLIEAGYQLVGEFYKCGHLNVDKESLLELEENDIKEYIQAANEHMKEKKAEQERIEKEREELRKEREQIQKEREELAELRKLKAEKEAEEKKKVEPKKEVKETQEVKKEPTREVSSAASESTGKIMPRLAAYDTALNDIYDYITDKNLQLSRKKMIDKIEELRNYKDSRRSRVVELRDKIFGS